MYLIILFPLWDHSLITGWGSKPGRGSNSFGPLEDQQHLILIRRSELLTLNETNLPIGGGGGQQFVDPLVCDKTIWTHLGGSLTFNSATTQN